MRIPYVSKGPAHGDILKVFPEAKSIFKPEIKIVVGHQDIKQKCFALIDSGADSCLFPRDMAEVLGIDVRSGRKIMYTGIGGQQVPFYFHQVEIFLGKYQFKTMAGFANTGIGTSALLGQKGFFENFIVSFDYKNRFVEIRKSNMIDLLVSNLFSSRILSKLKLSD